MTNYKNVYGIYMTDIEEIKFMQFIAEDKYSMIRKELRELALEWLENERQNT